MYIEKSGRIVYHIFLITLHPYANFSGNIIHPPDRCDGHKKIRNMFSVLEGNLTTSTFGRFSLEFWIKYDEQKI